MSAFYNERDPYAAQWLRNLIAAGEIAPGVVDERDIRDIAPAELAGFTQCHFFAGIGVWSRALRQAGWADSQPVWTGSCPCQPFSAAGQRNGFADERHLWPHWHWLIEQCRPAVVLGEQVASKDGLGWLDLVSADLEGTGYAFGASDLCAAGFGGAHIRQRLYFIGLADADDARLEGWVGMSERPGQCAAGPDGLAGGLDDAAGARHVGQVEGSESNPWRKAWLRLSGSRRRSSVLADANGKDCGGRRICGPAESTGADPRAALPRSAGRGENCVASAPMLGRHPADWLFCRDGKFRPVEPGSFPLANEAPARVGRLRAYGNALDAETAEEFVAAVKPAAMALLADWTAA